MESQSQWPRGLRCRSAAARLLRLWVRIPSGAWMSVCCECCVLSGRGLCDALITRPEESYRLWCVVVCDLDTSRMKRPWPALGRSATGKVMERENRRISYNKSQQDALFLNFILVNNSTWFRQTYCPSSGVLILYSQQFLFVELIMLTVC